MSHYVTYAKLCHISIDAWGFITLPTPLTLNPLNPNNKQVHTIYRTMKNKNSGIVHGCRYVSRHVIILISTPAGGPARYCSTQVCARARACVWNVRVAMLVPTSATTEQVHGTSECFTHVVPDIFGVEVRGGGDPSDTHL